MNDYIWLVCYFAACTVMFAALCIIYAKDEGNIKVKNVFTIALISYMPIINVLF